MNDIMIQFARLWGQLEATTITAKDKDVSDYLKSYDSEEVMNIVWEWSEEYMADDNNIEDSCDFFYIKIKEITKE